MSGDNAQERLRAAPRPEGTLDLLHGGTCPGLSAPGPSQAPAVPGGHPEPTQLPAALCGRGPCGPQRSQQAGLIADS